VKRQLLSILMVIGMAGSIFLSIGFAGEAFVPASPAQEDAYIHSNEYLDETLHVWIEDIQEDDSIYHVAYIEIADPAQLCTALSCAPGQKKKAKPSLIANAYNAVVAINGDYYLNRSEGYIVRQGYLLRNKPSLTLDMLIIDTAGDFHVVRKPAENKISEALQAFDIAHSFTFGPVLVNNSEVQTVYNRYGFAPQDRSPRTAIGQLGPLRYVMVVVDGRQQQSRGVTHKQLAAFMGNLGCTVAYNLDGGGTSTMIFHGLVYNRPSNGTERESSDVIYFATGKDPV